MLKYVALMEVDVPALWSGIYPMYNSTAQLFRSPIEEEREKVEQWLREQKSNTQILELTVRNVTKNTLFKLLS